MRSVDDDDIFVVGECAQHRGEVYGVVGPLWEQAGVLADVVTGANPDAEYHGSRLATKLKVAGVDVAPMGVKTPERESDEFVQFSETGRGVYQTVVIRDGTLIGATLVGDISKAAALTQAFDSRSALPEERVKLLFDLGSGDDAATAADLPDDTQVCNCNGVSKGDRRERGRRRGVGVGVHGRDAGRQGLRVLQGARQGDRRGRPGRGGR